MAKEKPKKLTNDQVRRMVEGLTGMFNYLLMENGKPIYSPNGQLQFVPNKISVKGMFAIRKNLAVLEPAKAAMHKALEDLRKKHSFAMKDNKNPTQEEEQAFNTEAMELAAQESDITIANLHKFSIKELNADDKNNRIAFECIDACYDLLLDVD